MSDNVDTAAWDGFVLEVAHLAARAHGARLDIRLDADRDEWVVNFPSGAVAALLEAASGDLTSWASDGSWADALVGAAAASRRYDVAGDVVCATESFFALAWEASSGPVRFRRPAELL